MDRLTFEQRVQLALGSVLSIDGGYKLHSASCAREMMGVECLFSAGPESIPMSVTVGPFNIIDGPKPFTGPMLTSNPIELPLPVTFLKAEFSATAGFVNSWTKVCLKKRKANGPAEYIFRKPDGVKLVVSAVNLDFYTSSDD